MAERKPWTDCENFKDEYVNKDKTQSELAEQWGCSQATVSKWKIKHGINKTEAKPWHDAEELRRLYHEKQMSSRQIAKEWSTTSPTILNAMRQHGIERRDRTKAHQMSMWRGPATFTCDTDGYEGWKTTIDRKTFTVYTHRLLAVAEYGFDAVCGKVVHHKNGIKWDNRPQNIELMDHSKHASEHAKETDGYIGKNLHLYD